MRVYLGAQWLRILIALMTLASSAIVIQAGQRWHA
jgi:hypothetical protein